MGWAGLGYLALGPAPAQFWVEGHLVDTGHTGTLHTAYRGTVTSHLAVIAAAVTVLERLQ